MLSSWDCDVILTLLSQVLKLTEQTNRHRQKQKIKDHKRPSDYTTHQTSTRLSPLPGLSYTHLLTHIHTHWQTFECVPAVTRIDIKLCLDGSSLRLLKGSVRSCSSPFRSVFFHTLLPLYQIRAYRVICLSETITSNSIFEINVEQLSLLLYKSSNWCSWSARCICACSRKNLSLYWGGTCFSEGSQVYPVPPSCRSVFPASSVLTSYLLVALLAGTVLRLVRLPGKQQFPQERLSRLCICA